ncbi:response regulator [Hyalangium gracile]|uniref:response regulator n=1 Tax=Hyalangium gracile TaxID=394092 RepID=UPI001CCC2C12|nr:response regulator [Hyalangium gracile]
MGHSSGSSILLVEDNEDIREGLSTLLEPEGYDVTAVGTAEEGLVQLETRRFDLVITDYMLPGENGGWMVEQAAKRSCLGNARVLMITAHPRVVPPPGVRILHKPLDIHALLRAVGDELAVGLQHKVKAS